MRESYIVRGEWGKGSVVTCLVFQDFQLTSIVHNICSVHIFNNYHAKSSGISPEN